MNNYRFGSHYGGLRIRSKCHGDKLKDEFEWGIEQTTISLRPGYNSCARKTAYKWINGINEIIDVIVAE